MTSSQSEQSTARKRLLIWLHVNFFFVGIITVLLGQILPVLSARLSLNDREAGYLFVAQFAGSLGGTFFYNRLIKKFGYLKILAGGFCLTACGCAGLNFASQISTAAAICLYGFGIGLTIPAVNLIIVELNRKNSAAALNIVNFCWGFGAISCKPFVDYVGAPDDIKLPTVLLTAAFLFGGAAIALSNYRAGFEKSEKAINSETFIWTTPTAWLIAIFNFVHIGIEASVGGWITTLEARLPESATRGLISAALVFFSFLVLGRLFAPLLFRFLGENAVLFGNLLIMTAGTILILRAENFSPLIIGAAILGFGSSTVFPTNISRFTKIFGAEAARNAAPLFICGTLGGAFMTWFIGFTSTALSDLRGGFSVILIGCFLLLGLQTILTFIKIR